MRLVGVPQRRADVDGVAVAAAFAPALRTIAVAHGDGIGPEIMDAVLHVLRHAVPDLRMQPVAMGEAAYRSGHMNGILPQTWDALAQHPVLLKGPMTTPQGGGYKSIDVTLRKTLGLFANVRPCVAYHPYVDALHPGMDVVIVRENEEDTYGGIEHRQTDEVVQCLKLITRPGCERIVRYAFEYALAHGLGLHGAMFEAVHGSAPDIAGKNIANPSGLLLAAVQMLLHIGEADAARDIHNAWLRTLEEGLHTRDLFNERTSRRCLGTREFAHAVVERLGQVPQHLPAVDYRQAPATPVQAPRDAAPRARQDKVLEGVDVFLDWDEAGRDPNTLARRLQAAAPAGLRLTVVTNRGVKVWPEGHPDTFCTDHWRCRFKAVAGTLAPEGVPELLVRLLEAGLPAVKTENLYRFDGQPGYSVAQGE